MTKRLEFEVFSLFPAAIEAFCTSGILGRAMADDRLSVRVTDFRRYTDDKHGRVDDAPFGGGPGMTIRVQPVADALAAVERERGPMHRVLLTPSARRFDQAAARRLASHDRIALICGRYEGIDDRFREHHVDESMSIGDYVLNGGEAAALVVIEAVARLRDGVLGNAESIQDESFGPSNWWLEHPQYTRPAKLDAGAVPAVLLGGDHKAVHAWRRRAAVRRTCEVRPELVPTPRQRPWLIVVAEEISPDAIDPVFDGAWVCREAGLERIAGSLDSVARARDLRALRRQLLRAFGVEPAWIQVARSPEAADRPPELGDATTVRMATLMLDASDHVAGAAPAVFVIGTSDVPRLHLGRGFDAVLLLDDEPTRSRPTEQLAEQAGIEHPSHPVVARPLRAVLHALASELSDLRPTTSDP